MRKTVAAIFLCLCAAWAHADTIVTKTNDVIHGTILRLRNDKVAIETAFAGTLRIPRDQVKSMDFDDANREKSFYARTDRENKAKEEVRLGRDAKGNLVLIDKFTKENAVDQLKAIYFNANDELRAQPTMFYLPQTVYDYYCEDYKAVTGATPYNAQYKQTFLEGSDTLCTLRPLAAKRDAKYIQLSTRGKMRVGGGGGVMGETIQVDRFAPFTLTFSLTQFFGTQYESLSPERLLVATIDGNTALYDKPATKAAAA